MLFSVISPVYNVESYLCECIESVLKQTCTDFELVLIDDGSTDNSGAICNQYAMDYPNQIKVVHTNNSGPFKARLKGVDEASGEILVFLDSDDCLRKDALFSLKECFDKYECDMVLYDSGQCENYPSIEISNLCKEGEVPMGDSKSIIYEKIINRDIPNSLCLKAVRKHCTSYPEHFKSFVLRHGEDLLLSLCFISNCEKIVYLCEELYHYRNRVGSAIHSFNHERKESVKTVHTEIEKIIKHCGNQKLIKLHNTRKVIGWIYNFKLLLKNHRNINKDSFKTELVSMIQDPYFRLAYVNMDRTKLTFTDRFLACLLYNFPFIKS